jgi:amidase
MSFAENGANDALGLAELVRMGKLSPVDLVRTALHAIELLNPRLNAVIRTLANDALMAAEHPRLTGPFAGVPLLLKDTAVSLAGVPTEYGSRYFKGYTRSHDSELVRRCKQAGFIILGKSNTSEFGTSGSTDTVFTGAMRNPWDLERIPGGSSGGSAAAVAAGIVPVAHATDAGGSLRGPAAWCGLVGLKPTRGRVSAAPDEGDSWLGLATLHVVTRSVRDSAATLDCSAGPALGDPHMAPPPARSFLSEVEAAPKRLRIGFASKGVSGPSVQGETLDALHATVRLLDELGHHVEEATPSWDAKLLGEAIMAICATVVAEMVDERQAATGVPPNSDWLEKSNLFLLDKGRGLPAIELLRATRKLNTVSRAFAQFFENYDIWLTPTMGDLPPKLGYLDSTSDDITVLYDRLWNFYRFNSVYNATGFCLRSHYHYTSHATAYPSE